MQQRIADGKAAEIEKTISAKLGQRPDGIVNNKIHRTLYILEFKQSFDDINEKFLRVKEVEADKQHKSIIGALKAAAGCPGMDV